MIRPSPTLAAVALVLAIASPQADQPAKPAAHLTHVDGLGSISFPNSGNAAAQAPFIRGVLLLHSFEYDTAAEAFRQAQTADAGFALAYWGEAMTYNHPLWQQQDRDAALKALGRLAASRRRARRQSADRSRAAVPRRGRDAVRRRARSTIATRRTCAQWSGCRTRIPRTWRRARSTRSRSSAAATACATSRRTSARPPPCSRSSTRIPITRAPRTT